MEEEKIWIHLDWYDRQFDVYIEPSKLQEIDDAEYEEWFECKQAFIAAGAIISEHPIFYNT